MIINTKRPNIELSGELGEQSFSIADTGMLFDILRSKMYSNPIYAICREISCNARDAHREVGKFDVPIQISLPTSLDPYYKIKDWGPGISPDRMENVFIKYTASTKRNDNVQTGGWGCGSKTPFSYTDTFSIVTVYDGIKYNYSCIVDESKIGKLILLSQNTTKDPNGTEIIVPVKVQDFENFNIWTEQSIRHFEVKPIINNGKIVHKNYQKLLDRGTGWALYENTSDYNYSYYNTDNAPKAIVDGIEYPLDKNAFKKYCKSTMVDMCRGVFLLYFGVGELSLSASREQVHLDDETKEKISSKFKIIEQELSKYITDELNKEPDLWKANIKAKKIAEKYYNAEDFLSKITWKGCQILSFTRNNSLPGIVTSFDKTSDYYNSSEVNRKVKVDKRFGYTLDFDPKSVFFLNDIGVKSITSRHAIKLFESIDQSYNSIEIFTPNQQVTEEELNQKYHLDKMNVQKISSVIKIKKRSSESKQKLVVYKLSNYDQFSRVSYNVTEEDTNRKIICILDKEKTPRFNNKYISNSVLSNLISLIGNVSVYGVNENISEERIEEDFSNFESLDDFIEETFSNISLDFVKLKAIDKQNIHTDSYEFIKNKGFGLIENSNSKLIECTNKILNVNLSEVERKYLNIYENLYGTIDSTKYSNYLKNNPDCNVENLEKEIIKYYPMFDFLNIRYLSDYKIEPIIEYVNLIDKKKAGN